MGGGCGSSAQTRGWQGHVSPDPPGGSVDSRAFQLSATSAESSLARGSMQPVTARPGIKASNGAPGPVNLRRNGNVNVALLLSVGW